LGLDMQRRTTRANRGFSLLELALVVGIVAVVAGMAAPRFSGATMRYRVALTARRIAADLNLAQSWARTSSKSQKVAFEKTKARYRMTGVRTLDNRSVNYEVDLGSDPHLVTLVSADFGEDPNVTFDAYGAPDSGGTVVIEASGMQKTITLDAYTGRTSIE